MYKVSLLNAAPWHLTTLSRMAPCQEWWSLATRVFVFGMGDGLGDACCCTFSFYQWEMEMGKCLGDAQHLLATPFHPSTESGFFPAEAHAMIA